jgi:hypothetical protein
VTAPFFVTAGQPFAATVTVTSAKGKPSSPPLGTVSLCVDGIIVATANVDAAGLAKFDIAGLPPGAHTIVAQYLGDPSGAFAGSTSAATYTFAW